MAAAAPGLAQIDEDQLGAWYMYFGAGDLGEPGRWGVQGDAQYRNWDLGGDLEQLLLRGGLTYRPDSINALFTLARRTSPAANSDPATIPSLKNAFIRRPAGAAAGREGLPARSFPRRTALGQRPGCAHALPLRAVYGYSSEWRRAEPRRGLSRAVQRGVYCLKPYCRV